MPVSFILSAVSAAAQSPRTTFCGRCVRHASTRPAGFVARRPRVRLPISSAASSSPAAGRPASARSLARNGASDDALVSSQVGSTAFSAGDARNSLFALGREYLRLASAEPFILYRLVGALALVFLSKFITLSTPFLYRRAVDTLTIPSASLATFAVILLLHCLAKIVASVTRELRNGVFVKAGVRVGRRVTALSFAHILGMEAAFHGASQTGALTRIVDRGTRSILTIMRGVLFSFLPTILELVMVCFVLFTNFSGWYVVVTMITFAFYLMYTFALNNRMGLLRADMNEVENETSAKITDSFFNFDAVTAFDNRHFETRRYDESLKKSESLMLKNEWLYVALNAGQNAIFMTGLSCMLLMCGQATLAGTLTVGSFAMLSSMLYQLWQPLSFLGWQYREVKQSLIDLQNLFQLLQRQPIIQDADGAEELSVSGGEISFENVSFAYPDDSELDIDFIRKPSEFGSMQEFSTGEKTLSKAALSGITFTVQPGKSLALVGTSGSGKSSTLRLLYRLYDVASGRILIDGQDVSNVTLSSLRHSIGIVPQDTVLFNDTIAYNLRYARPSATDDEIVAAAKAAAIHDTIMATPLGYDTLVGERGIKLSGGERQRVAIARIIIRNPRILLLDEPTSALDAVSEGVVQDALDNAAKGRTTIIVAHRLSTVRNADTIAVIHQGKIAEMGTHTELLRMNGRYAELVRNQMENVEIMH